VINAALERMLREAEADAQDYLRVSHS
jgi:hypothetical protein